jgi:hypothetical protein
MLSLYLPEYRRKMVPDERIAGMEWLFSWECTSVVVVAALGTAIGVLAMNDFRFAKFCFLVVATDAIGGTAMAISRSGLTGWAQGVAVFIAAGLIGLLFLFSLNYVDSKKEKSAVGQTQTAQTTPTGNTRTPSLVFVFGVPLGDNDSASWMMMLRHFGPNPAHNCSIDFFDDDRKNIEHQWLAAHPDSPFPPPGLAAGESQKHVYVAETGPEGSPGGFSWNPLDPDRQHYTVSISCRDGVFVERWEVTRVDGILRSTITIARGPQWVEKNPNLDPVVFRCSDPELVSAPLANELPKSGKARVVHPGWKPKHRFEVPAAIIDPNGQIQVMSGVKLPDGSTLTDFGCWNILTRHFGDNPNEARQQ